MKHQVLTDSFERGLVPKIVHTYYRRERATTARIVTPNRVPGHNFGHWESPNPRLTFDIRFGQILPRINDLQAAPTDLLILYLPSRHGTHGALELIRATRRAMPETGCFLVSCGCNLNRESDLEDEFGPLIWTPDCGGNLALPKIIDTLVDHWPIG